MHGSERLVLAHVWVAFGTMVVAAVLGAWQMFARSPLLPWVSDPELYYRSVTFHGSALAYVFPTLFAMGFGYATATSTLDQPLSAPRAAWVGFWLVIVGALFSLGAVAAGEASVLYTFYPPLTGHPLY